MKKLILTITFIAAVCTGAFARGDFGVFYYLEPAQGSVVNVDNSTGLKAEYLDPAYFGIGIGGDIYFGKPVAGFIDIGLALDGGFNISPKGTVQTIINGQKYGNPTATPLVPGDSSPMPWFGGYFSIGPSVNFNFGKRLTLYVCPAIDFSLTGAGTFSSNTVLGVTTSIATASVIFKTNFDLGVAARLWVGTNFGFNAGVNFAWPLAGVMATSTTTNVDGNVTKANSQKDVSSGFDFKIKLGVIWRFGKY